MEIVPSTPSQTLIYVVAPPEVPQTSVVSFLPHTGPASQQSHVMAWAAGCATWVLTDTQHVNQSILLASDACLFVIDGNLGVSPALIDACRLAIENSIPVGIGVLNSIHGRADFDEVLAVVQRVMDEDALARYLPIESDADEGIAGLFDLLTTDIHVLENDAMTLRQSDPEHVSLTAEKRADLIEVLAHFGLNDAQLDSLASGNPISIPALEQAYRESHTTMVIPIDEGVARKILSDWTIDIEPRWIPTATDAHSTQSVLDIDYTIGIGIDKGIARVWNTNRATWLERLNKHGAISDAIECTVRGGFMWASDVSEHDTIRPAESQVVVHAPTY